MRVAHLSLGNFRNYATVELPLEPGPNLIVGRNGQGKTNLVEAIAYLSTLRSHRVSSDSALIRAGQDSAIVRMRVKSDERDVLLQLQINRAAQNRAQINRNNAKPRELTRWFSSVMFAPEDLSIVKGDPATRRRFLDDALISRSPAAAGIIADYERVVRQRTALLKSARGLRGSDARTSLESTLTVWDDQLIDFGSRIIEARRQLITDLAGPVARGYGELVGEDHRPRLSLSESILTSRERQGVSRETSVDPSDPSGHVSRETLQTMFREALLSVREQELERGVTLIGPHRDDLTLELNGLPVKGYASHGESWSFALALRLGLAAVVRDESLAGDPVIILDDVFAELDARRRKSLMSAVLAYEQVLVTAAVAEDVPQDVSWNTIRVTAGEIGLKNAGAIGESAVARASDAVSAASNVDQALSDSSAEDPQSSEDTSDSSSVIPQDGSRNREDQESSLPEPRHFERLTDEP